MTPTAVVTGGAGGLGQAFARRLAATGYDVVPVDIADGVRHLDVTDADACRALAHDVRPALWINNAGVGGVGGLLTADDARVRRLVEVNLLGVINGTRAAAATMAADGGGGSGTDLPRGVVLNVASLAGWAPTPHISVYSATKNAVRAFSVAADIELRPGPPRVKCLLPDGIRTPMVDAADSGNLMSFTAKRLLEPDEVAAAGMRLIASEQVLASLPRRKGAALRLMGLWPGLSARLVPLIERRAERNREAELARRSERS